MGNFDVSGFCGGGSLGIGFPGHGKQQNGRDSQAKAYGQNLFSSQFSLQLVIQ